MEIEALQTQLMPLLNVVQLSQGYFWKVIFPKGMDKKFSRSFAQIKRETSHIYGLYMNYTWIIYNIIIYNHVWIILEFIYELYMNLCMDYMRFYIWIIWDFIYGL